MRLVVLLGLVSLCADICYEGMRGGLGPFLRSLGATGAAVGAVAGFGELLGYLLRLPAGRLADRPSRVWPLLGLGYGINAVAVPALAAAGSWPAAAGLLGLERLGKALRTPARDSLLAGAAAGTGHGKAFALHEALDRVGSMAGPLWLSAVAARTGSLRLGFFTLGLPALGSLILLAWARREAGSVARTPSSEEKAVAAGPPGSAGGLDRRFWLLAAASGFVAAGLPDFALVGFHLQREGLASAAQVPALYAAAHAAYAAAALALGRLFDRAGPKVLAAAPVLGAAAAPLAFSESAGCAFAGVALWGAAFGAASTVMRAQVARLAAPDRRGSAFGAFHALFGVSWFAGSALLGSLYDRSPSYAASASVALHLAALVVLAAASRDRGLDAPRTAL